jgi:hypothetical protein
MHGERHASPVANQMAFTPALGALGRVRNCLVAAMHRADGTTVNDRSRSINPIVSSAPIQQREVNEIPQPLVANRAGGANTSSLIRTQVPAGASAKECCEGQTQCR